MNINREGLELIERFEGLRLDAYLDVAGIATIGVGHTGPDVRMGMPSITREQAEMLLRKDLQDAEKAVNRTLGVAVNDNEYSALVSLCFNIGGDAFAKSTVVSRLKMGNRKGAADAFLMWNKARMNGKKVVVQGLTRRREAERALFLKPVQP